MPKKILKPPTGKFITLRAGCCEGSQAGGVTRTRDRAFFYRHYASPSTKFFFSALALSRLSFVMSMQLQQTKFLFLFTEPSLGW